VQLPFDSVAAEAAGVYSGGLRKHADKVCVVGARRRLAGNGDLVGETGNPRVGARARPEGKIASVTIAGRTGDLLF
jgi:hypothetical protein